jgi:hypothetical protein
MNRPLYIYTTKHYFYGFNGSIDAYVGIICLLHLGNEPLDSHYVRYIFFEADKPCKTLEIIEY